MPRQLVVNASPLIILAKTGFLDLLRLSTLPVLVPSAVFQEVQQLARPIQLSRRWLPFPGYP